MDSNRDDAQRCLDMASTALADGDLDKATRLVDKSRRMYPRLADAQDRLSAAIQLARVSSSNSSSSSSTSASSSQQQNGSSSTAQRHQNTDDQPDENVRKATPAMKSAVQRVNKLRSKSHYEVLGIEKSADEAAVKKAYRKLALQLHPDRNFAKGADEAFKRVSAAFVVLSDSSKRAHYDQFGTDPDAPPAPGPSPAAASSVFMNGVPLDQFFQGGNVRMNAQGVAVDDLFDMLFNGPAGGGTAGGGTGFYFNSNGMRFTTPRRRRRPQTQRARSSRTQSDDDTDNDDDNGANERAYTNDGSGNGGGGGMWERLKPLMFMLAFMLISMFLSEDGARRQPLFSLQRNRHYSMSQMTANGIPFYINSNTALSKRDEKRLWYTVDRHALEQFHVVCEQETAQESDLRYRSRSWLVGSKARQAYKRQLEQFRKPGCEEYQRLLHSIRRNGR